MAPNAIINDLLIPAITKVGDLYDKQVYFLPQLIASANTMETAIAYLEPLIKKAPGQQDMATIVIATVEGDVHDIGKNLVKIMEGMRRVVSLAEEKGIRDKVRIFVGGAPISQSFCDEIGADVYTEDAGAAARAAVEILRSCQSSR